jgi:hypothetical protein
VQVLWLPIETKARKLKELSTKTPQLKHKQSKKKKEGYQVKKVKHKPPMLACPIIGIIESDQDISKLNGRLDMITVSIWYIQKELHQEEVINLYHRGRELYDLHFRHTRIHRHLNLSKFKHNLGELKKQWHNTAKRNTKSGWKMT